MIKMEKDEFLSELVAEVSGYEEIDHEKVDEFIGRIEEYILKNAGKNKKIVSKGDTIMIHLEDESKIFDIVDQYLAAVVHNETEAYWTGWKL